MTGTALTRHVPVGAAPALIDFDEMLRRCTELCKAREVIRKEYWDKPQVMAFVGMRGAELGFSLGYSIANIDIIEGKPVVNAEARLTLLRLHGHEAIWDESTPERATLRYRRREYRNDPEMWRTYTYTLDMARESGLLDQWVERRYKNQGDQYYRTEKYVVGDDHGINAELVAAAAAQGKEWVAKEIEAGKIKCKDNWRREKPSMIRAGCVRHVSRMDFSDVMAGAAIDVDFDPDDRSHDSSAGARVVEVADDVELLDANGDPITDADVVEQVPGDDDTGTAGEGPNSPAESADPSSWEPAKEVGGEGRPAPSAAAPDEDDLVDDGWRQSFAIACNEKGWTADQRHAAIAFATKGRTATSTELRWEEVPEVRRVYRAVLAGEYRFVELDGEVMVGRADGAAA